MGDRGPRKKPTALKLIEGNRGRRPLNQREPKPAVASGGVLACPGHLDGDARVLWERLAPGLKEKGVLTEWDLEALAALCVHWAEFRRADELLKKRRKDLGDAAELLIMPSGYCQAHPFVTMRTNASKYVRLWMHEFGLTPASRADIVVGGETTDELGEYLRKLEKAG